MIPAEFAKLSPVTLRGWFWQQAVLLDKTIDLSKIHPWFTESAKGSIGGVIPSLDSSLEDCARQGKRTSALDGSLRRLIGRGYSKIAPIKPLLVKLSYELDRRFPAPLPAIPGDVRNALPASEQTIAQLNGMVRFGALNVSYFAETPPKEKLTAIKNRSWAILQDGDRSAYITKASAPVISSLAKGQMQDMAEGVLGAQGGVCTTFAAAAVHMLLNDSVLMATNPRIEFVSGPKHCLCLVNREVNENDIEPTDGKRIGTIVSKDLWNDGVVIVDPWAGAMGYHVFSSKLTYPAGLASMIGSKVDKYFDTNW